MDGRNCRFDQIMRGHCLKSPKRGESSSALCSGGRLSGKRRNPAKFLRNQLESSGRASRDLMCMMGATPLENPPEDTCLQRFLSRTIVSAVLVASLKPRV